MSSPSGPERKKKKSSTSPIQLISTSLYKTPHGSPVKTPKGSPAKASQGTPKGSPTKTPTGTPQKAKQREVLGQGSTGCIVYPSITFADNPDFVGKWIANKNIASSEYAISKVLAELDKDQKYLIYPLSMIPYNDPPDFNILQSCKVLQKKKKSRRNYFEDSQSQEQEPFFYELPMLQGSVWNYLIMDLTDFTRSIVNVLKGVEILEKAGYVHQDLEPKNIISYKNNSRIIDFSECKKFEEVYTKANEGKLTNLSPIIPPEVLIYTGHTREISPFLYRMNTGDFKFRELWMELHGYTNEGAVKETLEKLKVSKSDWVKIAKKMDIYAIGTIILTYLSINKVDLKTPLYGIAKNMTMLDPIKRADVSKSIKSLTQFLRKDSSS